MRCKRGTSLTVGTLIRVIIAVFVLVAMGFLSYLMFVKGQGAVEAFKNIYDAFKFG